MGTLIVTLMMIVDEEAVIAGAFKAIHTSASNNAMLNEEAFLLEIACT